MNTAVVSVAAAAAEHILRGGKGPGPCSWPGLAFEFCQSWVLEKMSSCWGLPLTGGAEEGAL